MIENFRFNDIILYAKGWYQRKDLVEDLGYLFSKIYAWTPTTEEEVAKFMLRTIDRLYEEMKISFKADSYSFCFVSIFDKIEHDMRFYEQSRYRATIGVCLNILSELNRDQIKLNPPHYGKKEHFRMGRFFKDYPISMTYTEMNRIAQKTFCQ